MPRITRVGRVLVPVADQDDAIQFYTDALGFSVTADVPFGEGDRWVEVTPAGGGASLALSPPQGQYQPGRAAGVASASPASKADHAELEQNGGDADRDCRSCSGPGLMGFCCLAIT